MRWARAEIVCIKKMREHTLRSCANEGHWAFLNVFFVETTWKVSSFVWFIYKVCYQGFGNLSLQFLIKHWCSSCTKCLRREDANKKEKNQWKLQIIGKRSVYTNVAYCTGIKAAMNFELRNKIDYCASLDCSCFIRTSKIDLKLPVLKYSSIFRLKCS